MEFNRNLIYLYDLPKDCVSSVKIAEIIKTKANYDITEPIQFRECPPDRYTGLPSPFYFGIIKINDGLVAKRVADAIKYFDISNDITSFVWHCRALPYDRDLQGVQRSSINTKKTILVKNLPKNVSHGDLEKALLKYGPVKSAKVSMSLAFRKVDG